MDALVVALIYVLFFTSFMAVQTSRKELVFTAVCPAVWLFRHRLGRVVRVGALYYLAVALVVTSICSPPIHGVHRYVQVGGVSFNPTLLLSVASILILSTGPSGGGRRGLVMFGLSLFLLLLSKSYSLTLQTALAGCAFYALRNVKLASLVLAGCALVIGLSMIQSDNRMRRIVSHVGRSRQSYQTRRIEENMAHLRLIGPSSMASSHLPAWAHDLAFLDVLRKHGVLVGILLLFAHGAVICLFFEKAIYGGNEYRPGEIVPSIYYGSAVVAHVLVNVGVLPPAGIPMPFVGQGLSARLAYFILILYTIGAQWEYGEADLSERKQAVLIKYVSILTLTVLAVVVVILAT